MNKIVLIDDDAEKVLDYFGKIYKMLWKGKDEDGIAAGVVFFGDKFKKEKGDSDLQQNDVDNFYSLIRDMLRSHCLDEEQWNYNGDMFKKKEKLIQNMVKNMNIAELEDKMKELVERWRGEGGNGAENLEEKDCKPLVELMLGKKDMKEEQSTGNQYILLDVILLFDDKRQIEEGKPIISMGLYHAMKMMKYECYLYSSYAYDYVLMDKYKDIYKEQYGEEVEIYQGKDIFSSSVNSKVCLFYLINK